ncbi:MAG: phosphatase PAP2 family protein [Clostridiales bacterium]|nr:phosphatase PAP2 family protein [Clostridiales bacterium]
MMMIKDFIKKRHLVPIAVWFVCYMSLFVYLEIFEPESVHLISCELDRMIPHIPAFIYPYLSWFPYIGICAYLAIRNLGDADYRKAVFVLTAGMNIFLLISYVWPTGLDFRESITYHTETLSGWLMKFVQTVDTPKSVFPSMHVYVTCVLQYTLEMQKDRLPGWGVLTGRIFAVAIILSTMFTKQHSAVDVAGALVMFAVLTAGYVFFYEKNIFRNGQTDKIRVE